VALVHRSVSILAKHQERISINSALKGSDWTKAQYLAITAIVTLGFALSARAQSSASVSGTVRDSTDAVVVGATVMMTDIETQSTRTLTTDSSGTYQALSLPVGHYEVTVRKAGFQPERITGIDLVVGQEAVVNLTLTVGEASQEITVSSELSGVNTTTASVSGLVNSREIKDLPLNGRSFDNLITLNPGATNYSALSTTTASGNGAGNVFSVDGRYPLENLFLYNGVQFTGMSNTQVTPGGASGQMLGVDSIREFNVLSNTYSAEFGSRAGAQILVVTQSGTNKVHGSAFEFARDSIFDARNHFDGPVIPPFQRNQFGGAVGGPILKDRAFLFGNYEGFRQTLGLSDKAVVPDNNARQGILPCGIITPLPAGCAGTSDTTPMSVPGVQQGMLQMLAGYWPAPNAPSLGGGAATFSANPVQTIHENYGTLRADQNLTQKDTLSENYTIDDGFNYSPQANPVHETTFSIREQLLSAQEVHIFTPNVLNTFTAGFSRGAFFSQGGMIAPQTFPSNLTWVAGHPPGTISVGSSNAATSAFTAGGTNGVFNLRRNLFTYADTVQWVKGKNQLSFGVWFQPVQANEEGSQRGNGTATFVSLQTFLQGTTTSLQAAPENATLYWRTLFGAWFVQDKIQLTRNVVLEVGLRHEFTNGWNEAKGHAANYTYSNGVLVTNTVVGPHAFSVNNAKMLFGPRLGLAWDVFGNQKTALHAGIGTHYNLQDALGFQFSTNPPFLGTAAFNNINVLSVIPISSTIPLPPACGVGVPTPCTTYAPAGVQQDMKTPTVEAWQFSIDQQITPSITFTAAYVGSHAVHELITEDTNSIAPQICTNIAGCVAGGVSKTTSVVPMGSQYIPTGPNGAVNTRPNPYLSAGSFWQSQGKASYNALQLDFKEHISNSLDVRVNYTWAKTLDNGSGLTGVSQTNEPSIIMDRTNIHRDWGPSAQDIEQQMSANFGYNLPLGKGRRLLGNASGAGEALLGGWKINGIISALSGFPFTPQAGSNISGDGDTKLPDRPNRNPAFTGPIIKRQQSQWYNPQAFALEAYGTYGNASRNMLTGPRLYVANTSLFKNVRFSDRISAEFRAEAFNVFNHTNLGLPNATVFSGTNYSATAGLITSAVTTSRQLQFAAKLQF
jgi:hypothetical protein